jgi:hypothetical protein
MGVSRFSRLSLSQLWANRRRCRALTQSVSTVETFHPHDDETCQIGHMGLVIISYFFINSRLWKYTLYEEMPEDKKIAKMLLRNPYNWYTI